MWQCSQQHTNREEAKFCAKCGEKRVIRELCAECGTVLEPEDVFCTACGHRRASAAVAVEAVAPPAVAAVVAAPEPVREAPPVPAAAPPPVAAPPVVAPAPAPEPAPAQPVAEEEPVTFSFGGALIEMKDDSKTAKSAKASAGSASGESKPGMSSTTTGILSFVIFAAVLGIALYFFSR